MARSCPPLFTHQKQSVAFMMERPRVLDFSDCGTGKTRSQIETIAADPHGGATLVIGPKSILRPAWAEDIEQYAPHLKYSLAYAEKREKAFAADADVYLTNHDATTWLATKPASFFKRFKRLIIDESTAYKHHTSARSKAARKIAKYFEVRRAMTATPNTNNITDIWHQALLIDDGKRLGTSFFNFRAQVCNPVQVGPMPNMIRWEPKPGAEEAITHLLADIVIRHPIDECTDIPENYEYPRAYYLNPRNMAAYEEMKKQAILELGGERYVDAVNGAVLFGKLMQIASGAVYATDHSYTLLDSSRAEFVLDLVEERPQVVVFFNWAHQRDTLVAEAERRGMSFAVIDGKDPNPDRKNAVVQAFQRGEYRVLFIHPQSGAHGLTLTAATRTIWASPTFNLEHYHQGVKRIHRAGQREVTETVVVLAKGTVDEEVFAKCKSKQLRMNDLLQSLRDATHE